MRGLFPEKDLLRKLNEKVFGPRVPNNGEGSKKTSDPVLADTDKCWCGLKYGHDWPLKDVGAAHPPYPE